MRIAQAAKGAVLLCVALTGLALLMPNVVNWLAIGRPKRIEPYRVEELPPNPKGHDYHVIFSVNREKNEYFVESEYDLTCYVVAGRQVFFECRGADKSQRRVMPRHSDTGAGAKRYYYAFPNGIIIETMRDFCPEGTAQSYYESLVGF